MQSWDDESLPKYPSTTTDWKTIQVGGFLKEDLQEFRLEISAIQLPCKVGNSLKIKSKIWSAEDLYIKEEASDLKL